MSIPDQHGLRVIHIPRDAGTALWVYGDKDNIKVGREETGGSFTLVEVEFGPGAGPPPHVHSNEHEAFYVLEGQVDALDGDRRIRTGPGSFVFMPRGSHHAFKNTGNTFAKILLMFTPAGFEGYMKEFGTPWSPGSIPPESDMAVAIRLAAKYGMTFIDVPPGVWD